MSLGHCSGYLNGTRPLVWSGAGVYVTDDFFATGFFTSAFLAAASVIGFFMSRTVQHNSPGKGVNTRLTLGAHTPCPHIQSTNVGTAPSDAVSRW